MPTLVTPKPPVPTSPDPSRTHDPDRPGDPVHGIRVLTGTVEPGEPCAVLRSGGVRWALLGPRATGLKAGARVEVRGVVGGVPRGCHADHALQVSWVRPR